MTTTIIPTDTTETTATPSVHRLWPPTLRQLEKFVAIARADIDTEAMAGTGRPDGGRLSIECPVRRVKAIFDAELRIPFPEMVGRRGHLMEQMFEAMLLDEPDGPYGERAYKPQPVIKWGPSLEWRSAFDFAIGDEDDSAPQLVSIKSSTAKAVEKLEPSKLNMRQEDRMLEAAGCEVGTVVDFWMIHPGSLEVIGPFPHVFTEAARAACSLERRSVQTAFSACSLLDDAPADEHWNDAEYWQTEFNLECACGGCHKRPFESFDANAAIEKRVTSLDWHRRQIKTLQGEEAALKKQLVTAAEEQWRLHGERKTIKAYNAPLQFIPTKAGVTIREYKGGDA